jgi:hypothetical protein
MVTLTKDDSPPGYNESLQASRSVQPPPLQQTLIPTPAVNHYIDEKGCTVSFDPAVNADRMSILLNQ